MKIPSLASKFAALAALSLGLGSTVSIAAVNLVTNGGFETGDSVGWTRSGNLGFTGVTEAIPHSGTYHYFAGPVGSLGFLSQSLATVNGDAYTLSFWLRNPGLTPTEFNVSWNGSIIASLTQTNTPDSNGYIFYSVSGLAATSGSTILEFGFRHDPASWQIDDISVESNGRASNIPDAGTSLGLMAVAMTALAGARRWMR